MYLFDKLPIIGTVILAGSLLTGCVTDEEQYEIDRGNAYQRCSSFGHRAGTSDFNYCLEKQDFLNRTLLQERQVERGRALRHTNENWREQQRHDREQRRQDEAVSLLRDFRTAEIMRDHDRRMSEIDRNHERRMNEIRQRKY